MNYWDYFLLRFDYWWEDALYVITHPELGHFVWFSALLIVGYYLTGILFPWRKEQPRFRKEAIQDIFYTLFNLVIFWELLGGFALNDVVAVWFSRFLHDTFGMQNLVMIRINHLPEWAQILILFVVRDFMNYWVHRLTHRIDFLWQFHKLHHSAREIDALNLNRFHFFDLMLYPLILYIPVGMIGYSIRDYYLVFLITSFFSIGAHANIPVSYGPLRFLFNNPKMHLWHHAKKMPRRYGVNFGDALSIWDNIFGTAYYKNQRDGVELGFDDIDEYPKNVLQQWIYPVKRLFKKRSAVTTPVSTDSSSEHSEYKEK